MYSSHTPTGGWLQKVEGKFTTVKKAGKALRTFLDSFEHRSLSDTFYIIDLESGEITSQGRIIWDCPPKLRYA